MVRGERVYPSAVTLPLWPEVPHGAAGDPPRLTPFLLDGPGPHPAIVVCPGGGYRRRADHEGAPIARWLNGLGIAAIVLDYRVAPHRHPAPLDDARRAIQTVRARAAEWRVDPARVGLLGFSAGGHLAATAGTQFVGGDPVAADPVERQSSRPDLLVLCYPVITFGPERHEGSMLNLLGDDPPEEWRRALSAEQQVTRDTPPTFLWHTAEDGSVPVANSLLFARALADVDVPFAFHVFPKGRHGLGLAADDPIVGTWTTLCAAWLRDQGFGTAERFGP
jgi:acetyl esterase/lipase